MTGREISGRVTGAECDPLAAAAAQRESVFLFCLPHLHLRVPQLSFSTCLSLSLCVGNAANGLIKSHTL